MIELRGWPHLRLRARRALCAAGRRAQRALRVDRTVYVDQRVDEYRAYWTAAAEILGAELVGLTDEIWEVRLGDRRARVANYMAGRDDSVTRRIAGDKLLCYRLARARGIPTPDHLLFDLTTISRAREFVRGAGGTFVVKPRRDTASGLGITLGVRTPREVERAAVLASLYGSEMLIERMVPGESYRLLYLEGRLLHAVRRRGLRVEGDGRSDVRTLLRLQHPDVDGLDELDVETLRLQGLAPTDSPARGRSVLVRGNAASSNRPKELRTVYDEPVAHLISDALDREARQIVQAVGSAFAGVDVVTVDPRLPLREGGGAFLELNTTPGIHHHYQTEEDHRSHPVAVAVLGSLLHSSAVRSFRPTGPEEIPVPPPEPVHLATL